MPHALYTLVPILESPSQSRYTYVMATKKAAPSKKRPKFSPPKVAEVDTDAVVTNDEDVVSVFKDVPEAPAPPRLITKKPGAAPAVQPAKMPEPPADMVVNEADDEEVPQEDDAAPEVAEQAPEEEVDLDAIVDEIEESAAEEDAADPEPEPEVKEVQAPIEPEEDLEGVLDDIEEDTKEADMTSDRQGSSINIGNLILLVALFLFGLLGWALYLNEKGVFDSLMSQPEEMVEEVVEEPTPAPEPTPAAVEQLERTDIRLEILNGSGVSGAAGRQQDIFAALGYETIEVGNADATEGNELYVHPDYLEAIDVLLEDVEDELDIATISGQLDEDSELTAQIVLGS